VTKSSRPIACFKDLRHCRTTKKGAELSAMTNLERNILKTLANAKERHASEGWLAGPVDTDFGTIRGLGRITTTGERELKRLEPGE
jgi:hypothetical protein